MSSDCSDYENDDMLETMESGIFSDDDEDMDVDPKYYSTITDDEYCTINNEEDEDDDSQCSTISSKIRRSISTLSSTSGKSKFNLDKLNVLFKSSDNVPNNIKNDDMMIIKFTNFAFAVPPIDSVHVEEECPKIDTSIKISCIHKFTKIVEQTRRGDEAFSVIMKCTLCNFIKRSS